MQPVPDGPVHFCDKGVVLAGFTSVHLKIFLVIYVLRNLFPSIWVDVSCYIPGRGLAACLGPLCLRLGKNGSQLIALTWSLVFSSLLLPWLLLLLKKISKQTPPIFCCCSHWALVLLIFFLLASKQILIKFTMYYIGVSFENLTFEVLKHCHILDVYHFVCQICLKLSSSWNFNLKWMSIFSRLRKTCCFYLKLIHNSSSEMLFFLFGFTLVLKLEQISLDFWVLSVLHGK